jgi:diguanylate cyclase (GGDEF)-like protein
MIWRTGARTLDRNTELLFRFASPAWAVGAVAAALGAAANSGLRDGGQRVLVAISAVCVVLAVLHRWFRWGQDSLLMVVVPVAAVWIHTISIAGAVEPAQWPAFQAGQLIAIVLTALFTSRASLVVTVANALVAGAILAAGDGTQPAVAISSWFAFAAAALVATIFISKLAAQRRATIEQLQVLAMTDSLTGIANRRRFMGEAARSLREAHLAAVPVTLVLVDIDHFKQINDTAGHDAGDRVLVDVAHALSEACRPADLVGRLGGEEFGMLLAGASPAHAEDVIAKASSALSTLPSRSVTASYGVTQARLGEESVTDLLIRADAALYEAKRTGRNRAVVAPS